jgi:sugar O-acyltransferase (sialic acid O-acetyltransferase NeuD family)
MRTLLILGAGGHGKVVAEAALLSRTWEKVAFVDDRWPELQSCFGLPVLSNIAGLFEIAPLWTAGISAVGNNILRKQWLQKIRESALDLGTVIHPTASVSPTANIGGGTAIMALAMVGVDAQIGEGSIINAHSTVDHDAKLGDFVHLGVGVHLAGEVQIGSNVWLKVGCCVSYQVIVAEGAVCGPGTVLCVRENSTL